MASRGILDDIRLRWARAISNTTSVCEKHFRPEDYKYTPVRRTLKPGSVPSMFPWSKAPKSRKEPAKRTPLVAEKDNSNLPRNDPPPQPVDADLSSDIQMQTISTKETDQLKNITQLNIKIKQLQEENQLLKTQLSLEKFGISRFGHDDSMIQYYTGFPSYDLFKLFFEFVQPSACNMCSLYYVCSETVSLAGRPRTMSLIDEMFMFFNRLRIGLPEQDLAVRYNCHIATVSRKLLTWTNFLYMVLGSIPIWPTRDRVDFHMPQEFRMLYPSTRVILDCTEMRIQVPSALVLNSMFFSHYKSGCTLKGLIGIAPHGALTFVSQLFTGVMSDVEITKLSGILDLLEQGDSVMADKGFTIASVLSKRGVGLNIPPFLHSQGQFSADEVKQTQQIAALRIHVERFIRRIKQNHLFDSTISISELGSINQLWTVACIASGFQGPLLKKTSNAAKPEQ